MKTKIFGYLELNPAEHNKLTKLGKSLVGIFSDLKNTYPQLYEIKIENDSYDPVDLNWIEWYSPDTTTNTLMVELMKQKVAELLNLQTPLHCSNCNNSTAFILNIDVVKTYAFLTTDGGSTYHLHSEAEDSSNCNQAVFCQACDAEVDCSEIDAQKIIAICSKEKGR